jgi:predicted transposase/invertase (TIGR01784 family)
MEINNIHDKFVKELLSDKEIAISFLSAYLPQEDIQILDISSLEYATTNYITSELEEFFSDIVFKINLKNSQEFKYVSILLEHKSRPDNFTIIQVGSYLFSGYLKQIKNKEPLHIIIPLVYYNGEKKWEVKTMQQLFSETPEVLQKYIPFIFLNLVDLSQLSEEDILKLQDGFLASSLLVQKYRFDPDALTRKFELIINTLAPYYKRNFLQTIVVYLLNTKELSNFDFDQLINNDNIQPEIKEKIMTIADYLTEKGEARGKAIGEARGKAIGEAIERERALKEKEISVCKAYGKVQDIAFVADIMLLSNDEVKVILAKHNLL